MRIKINHMKKIILLGVTFLTLVACTQNKSGNKCIFCLKSPSGGKFLGEGENNGKKYVLGNDDAVTAVLNIAKHYSAKDVDEMFKHYSKEFTEKNYDNNKRWLDSMESISMKPYAIIPVKIEGSDKTQVLTWSVEERNWKNGSKQKQNLMEIFTVDTDNKIDGFAQWRANYPTNEFGLAVGGKFFGKTDNQYTGRGLVFSNRGEVEAIEKLVESYNKMDVEGCKIPFADEVNIEYEDGRKALFTPSMWEGYFKDYKSVSWKPYSIVPLKIYDTDPASGVIVTSREKRVMRDDSVWDRELVEFFYFNLDGKIDNMTQFSRKIK